MLLAIVSSTVQSRLNYLVLRIVMTNILYSDFFNTLIRPCPKHRFNAHILEIILLHDELLGIRFNRLLAINGYATNIRFNLVIQFIGIIDGAAIVRLL